MKNWYSINASAAEVAEVTIYDEIGFWGITASRFLSELSAVQAPTVRLFINSPGGSVIDALAIFNGLRQSGKRIEVKVMGVASSAASYIAMAGDHITMPENTMMFLHRPIAGQYGNADDMRDMADVLDKFGASLTATYARRFKGEAAALDQILADETWLTAQECLGYGLCDEVTPAIEVHASFDLDRDDLPENVRALLASRPASEPAPQAQPAARAVPMAEQIAARARDAGLADLGPLMAARTDLTDLTAVDAVIANALEVQALLRVVNKPDRIQASLASFAQFADVRAQINAEMVAEDESTLIRSTPQSGPSATTAPKPGLNVVNLWAEIHTMEKSK